MKDTLEFLVIGKSGHGKSSFIMTFIDDNLKNTISITGEGQTTRFLSEYKIDCINENIYKAEFCILSKEEFCERGINYAKNCLVESNVPETIKKDIRNKIINNLSYFSTSEFCSVCEMNNYFDRIVTIDRIEQLIKLKNSQEESDENNQLNENYNDLLNDCLEYIYSKAIDELIVELKNKRIEIKNNKFLIYNKDYNLEKMLKKDNSKLSFSSLIKEVKFNVSVNEKYKKMCQDLSIKKIVFVDTYGIDQFENASKEEIKGIYIDLLLGKYSNIENVLFIRKANKESSVDLPENMSLLYDVKPSVVSYVVFTHMDSKDASKDKGLMNLKNIESDVYIQISKKLEKQNMPQYIISNRLKIINNNIVEYSSVNNTYREMNEKSIRKLFNSIIDNEVFGTNYIDEENMLPEKYSEIFNNDLLANYKYSFHYLPPKTKWALKRNLKQKILGFWSTTCGAVGYFQHILYNNIKNLIKDINKFSISKSLNDGQKKVIQEIMYKWVNTLLVCECNNMLSEPINLNINCNNCKIKDEKCVLYNLYDEKKKEFSNENKYDRVYKWLDNIYNFYQLSKEKKIFIDQCVRQSFCNVFIKLCEEHNKKIKLKEEYHEIM